MAQIWKFSISDNKVTSGRRERMQLSKNGCNEPFKNRYWCPKAQWFMKEACPFINRRECENYRVMCGSL
ncbi:MAG: hypothetical protein BM485_02785 [Desulfobulbaceae bacterium DB1]|nr:MAG: hypothetical protein BM485_02785 [Desulfobulbaceae bacterium DB1]